jgi:hypothetical protein
VPFRQQREDCSHPNLSLPSHDSAARRANDKTAASDSPENRPSDHWFAVCRRVVSRGIL